MTTEYIFKKIDAKSEVCDNPSMSALALDACVYLALVVYTDNECSACVSMFALHEKGKDEELPLEEPVLQDLRLA